jgi:hypothetical protein
MAWAGQESCLIDRYDGRALLDLIPPPPAKISVPPADELLLERCGRACVFHTQMFACFTRNCTRVSDTTARLVCAPLLFNVPSFLNYERYRDLGAWLSV